MFRLFVVMAMLFMAIDARLNRTSLHEMDGESSKKVGTILQEGPSLGSNLPSVLLTNYKNILYYGNIQIGMPPQEFRVAFSTESAYSWIFSKNCTFPFCLRPNKYNSINSYTYVPHNNYIDLKFVDHTVHGFISIDTMKVAKLTVANQTFVEVINASDINKIINSHVNILDRHKFDGIVGLLFSNLYDNITPMTPILDNMIQQGLVSSRIFSFYINRETSSANLGGKLTFGGSDPAYYEGNITYVPFSMKGYWQITIDSIQINEVTWCKTYCQAIIDTRWNIIGPEWSISLINRYIKTNPWGRVNCNSISQLPTITFNLGGKAFNLTGEDYIIGDPYNENLCASVFFSKQEDPTYDGESKLTKYWVLGIPFIGRYYTEFDIEKERMGFALAKHL